ncbi:hypothetical protein H5410_036193 [Solanum commersonii]|uniref:Uncharacterized protein n=1 Tax=Solanum commersonii TaxID=4109 RepID=A0A9J5Y3H5_SOLCO|nr:hypothetical protein H5410_036193 [Solanum commersonii]
MIVRTRTTTSGYLELTRVHALWSIIRGRDKDRVEGDGPAQAPTSIIATPVLQDALANPCWRLDSRSDGCSRFSDSQDSTSCSCSSLFREYRILRVSQVATSGIPFEKVVDAAKELEMIRCEGFEQHKGKRACHSSYYGGAPPRSQGTQGEFVTLCLADLFMLLYQRLKLNTLVIVLRVQCILHRVHLPDL